MQCGNVAKSLQSSKVMLKIVTSSEVRPKDTTAVRDVVQGRAAEGQNPQAQFEKAVEG